MGGTGRLAAGQVEVWRIAVTPSNAAAAEAARAVLDAEERRSADAFRREEDRTLYQVAHVGLRMLLADQLGHPPDTLPLRRGACPGCGQLHGRPEVAAEPPLEFSLSHAPGLALVALAADPVGADVEQRAAFDAGADADVATQLHPAERAELAELARTDPARSSAATLRCWVRKEAYLKGTGMGLGNGLALDYVGLGPDYPPPHSTGLATTPPGWALREVPVPARYDAAVALRLPPDLTAQAVRVEVADLDLDLGRLPRRLRQDL